MPGTSIADISVLIVEDDPFQAEDLAISVSKVAKTVATALNPTAALTLLEQSHFDVVLADLYYVDEASDAGFEFLRMLTERHPQIVPIAMSIDPNFATADAARRLGARDFLRKPLGSPDEIAIAIALACDLHRASALLAVQEKTVNLPPNVQARCPDGVVVSPEHRHLATVIAKNAALPAIIYGETGTGKEVYAKLIHKLRCAIDGKVPFVSVNCATLNSTLVDSVLFGHVKGSFSGADRTTTGLIGEANGGVLFLDEIHTLGIETQQKLLRVLNDGTYSRLGSTSTLRSQFQTIAASTHDLDTLVDQGRFLLDLRMRLSGFDVHMKPLRDRRDEMDLFIALFFAEAKVEVDPEEFRALVRCCKEFHWQGNVRQLYKALQALLIRASCDEMPIRHQDLPIYRTMYAPGQSCEHANQLPPASTVDSPVPHAVTLLQRALKEDMKLKDVIRSLEKAIIEAAIGRHSMLSEAYRALEIGRNTFDQKRKRLGISVTRIATAISTIALTCAVASSARAAEAPRLVKPQVAVEIVRAKLIEEQLRYPALVDAKAVVTLAEIDGFVGTLPANVGTVVQRGTPIAYLKADSPGYIRTAQPLRAPLAGRIAERYVASGDRVVRGQKILSILPADGRAAIIELLPRDAQRVRIGMPAAFTVAWMDKTVALRLDELKLVVDPVTGTVPARLSFMQPDVAPPPGTLGNVTLILNRHKAVQIPEDLIFKEKNRSYVWVIKDNKVEVRTITPGTKRKDGIEVTAGLAEGEQLVIKASAFLKQGDEVTLEASE